MRDQRPLILIVLDGWGVNPRPEGNAIAKAATPVMDRLVVQYPSTQISISGLDVGLPDGQMGNSEVGHMHLGAGRIVYQDLTLIHKAIDDGTFFSNPVFKAALDAVKKSGGRLHLMGLLGDGGVHSHQRHLEALIEFAKREKVKSVYLHLFLDGRDTPPSSAEGFIRELNEKLANYANVKIATVGGRYYGMDRDKRWDRTEKAYRAITAGVGEHARSADEAIRKSYQAKVTDEFMLPTVIDPEGTICDGDAVIFFNFRADRARQMTRALTQKDFAEFSREKRIALAAFATMSEYDATFNLPAAFPPRDLKNILGEVASRNQIPQLRIAETEKYAHVTYFFNGGEEKKFPLEERILIPSVKDVPTYDLKPEMSAYEIAGALVPEIEAERYGLVVLNYANADMVGHTGNFDATVRACEAVDACIGKVVDAALQRKARVIVTADHGNAEQLIDYDTGEIHTAHTSNPVPVIVVDDKLKGARLRAGKAIDVAPTILEMFGLPEPVEMTGKSLIVK
ncbi:MAG TPA: 2,3-bisphosphoglycerate-independent phosphoglycerate mutase [Candidatus Binatia bacterium]|nr:2,3-bisphosphoglycerate-independent phosphoglycerate mutase [Candidatus Binatia bacterium]